MVCLSHRLKLHGCVHNGLLFVQPQVEQLFGLHRRHGRFHLHLVFVWRGFPFIFLGLVLLGVALLVCHQPKHSASSNRTGGLKWRRLQWIVVAAAAAAVVSVEKGWDVVVTMIICDDDDDDDDDDNGALYCNILWLTGHIAFSTTMKTGKNVLPDCNLPELCYIQHIIHYYPKIKNYHTGYDFIPYIPEPIQGPFFSWLKMHRETLFIVARFHPPKNPPVYLQGGPQNHEPWNIYGLKPLKMKPFLVVSQWKILIRTTCTLCTR